MGEKTGGNPSSIKSNFLRTIIGLGSVGVVGVLFWLWRKKRSSF